MDGPAPPADRLVEPGLTEGRGAIEATTEPAARRELCVDRLHEVPAEQVVAAVPLVEERRVIEERLHEKQILAEQAAELPHRVEHPAEEPEPRADLTRSEPGSNGPTLLGKVPGQRAEERVLSVLVPIDAEPPRGRIGDLDEGKLGNPEGAHLDVHEDHRIAIVARSALAEKPGPGVACDGTTPLPTWSGGGTLVRGLDLSAIPLPAGVAAWDCYRYRVFETVVPVRNTLWKSS